VPLEIRLLIRDMSLANPLWARPRGCGGMSSSLAKGVSCACHILAIEVWPNFDAEFEEFSMDPSAV